VFLGPSEKVFEEIVQGIKEIVKGNEEIVQGIKEIGKGNEKIVKGIKEIGKGNRRIVELVLEEIADKDCYDRISGSSKPKMITKDAYTVKYSVAVPDLRCMITGISHNSVIVAGSASPKNPVTLAHLIPRNADVKERSRLGYDGTDIDNIRNTILLCKGFEEAFDSKCISFVPADNPFSNNKYKLHLWCDVVKSKPIFEGATLTIGDFDGYPLNLMVGTMHHDPFKRAMSYQAFRAFKMWSKELGLRELPVDSDTSVYNGSYKRMRAVLAQQLANDIASEEKSESDYLDDYDDGAVDSTDTL
jgi:hypothetical protein